MIYRRTVPVEFNHCDPAGIVFYPRYFEMTNSVVENFFAEVLNYPFSRIHLQEKSGLPTVHIEIDFRAPSRLGDRLDFTLEIVRVGQSSVHLVLQAGSGGQERLRMQSVLVWVSPAGKAAPWPAEIQEKMKAFKGKRQNA
ncbi:MAG: acyl-CoA thioesterase [Nitratireductor sp.]|nr:acyl-CoA thioesterase [Nitratireductor sp.]